MRRYLTASWIFILAICLKAEIINLPLAQTTGGVGINQVITKRRSVRRFSSQSLTLNELSQLLWSAQGITDPYGKKRSAPSAGAIYPLKLYVVVKTNGVKGIDAGIYLYIPQNHSIRLIKKGDYMRKLAEISYGQFWIEKAPIAFIFCADPQRMMARYRERAWLYIHLEAGMAGENLMLCAVSLELGSCAVGAFWDNKLANLLQLPETQKPLLIIPVGKKL